MPSRLKKYHVTKAINELLEKGEFTQYDLHDKLGELLGRPLTTAEKERATKIAKSKLVLKDIKREGPYKIRVYIFIL